MIDSNVILGAGISFAGATIAWGRSVEKRLAAQNALVDKIDALITLLLEDRLNNGQNQERRDAPQPDYPRSNR